MSIAGAGAGAGFGSPKPWTPASLFSGGAIAGFWADFDDDSSITHTVQPPLADAECESAASWTALNLALLTNEPGYSGDCMRVARNGSDSPVARQTVLTVGARYYLTCKARSDGNATADILAGSVVLGSVTTSTSWQTISGYAVADGTTFDVFVTAALDGQYIEIDSIELTSVNITSVDCSGSITPASQAVVSKMPYIDTLGARDCAHFEALHLLSLASLSSQRFLHDGTGATICAVFKTSSLAGYPGVFSSGFAATDVGVTVFGAPPNLLLCYIANGSGTYLAAFGGTAVLVDTPYIVRVHVGTANAYLHLNGALIGSSGYTGVPSAADSTWPLYLGNLGGFNGLDGCLGDLFAVAKVVGTAEAAQLDSYFARKHGIAL